MLRRKAEALPAEIVEAVAPPVGLIPVAQAELDALLRQQDVLRARLQDARNRAAALEVPVDLARADDIDAALSGEVDRRLQRDAVATLIAQTNALAEGVGHNLEQRRQQMRELQQRRAAIAARVAEEQAYQHLWSPYLGRLEVMRGMAEELAAELRPVDGQAHERMRSIVADIGGLVSTIRSSKGRLDQAFEDLSRYDGA